jgi:hypothetical protein
VLKILYPNGMLDLRLLYFNHDRRLTMTYVIGPFVIPENSQCLSYGLVDTGGTNFNHMFNYIRREYSH